MNYQIETSFQGPGFVAVPNHIAQDLDLSPEALGVLVYLASKPNGWRMSPDDVKARFGMGKDRWQRIARELRAVGAMVVEALRGAGGQLLGRLVRVRWPEQPAITEKRETRPSAVTDRKPENPAAGKPATESRKTRHKEPENPAPYKEERKKRGATLGETCRNLQSTGRPLSGPVPIETLVALSKFERNLLREGKSLAVKVDGRKALLRSGTDLHAEAMSTLQSLEESPNAVTCAASRM